MSDFSGTLKIVDKNGEKEYWAEYTNAKGKLMRQSIAPNKQYFEPAKAAEGAAIKVELKDGLIHKVTIDGQPEMAPKNMAKPPAPAARPSAPFRGGSNYNSRPSNNYSNRSGSPATAREAGLWATAPYNFIPYDRDHIVPGARPENGQDSYSGQIVCKLTALTPLLVAAAQGRGDEQDDKGKKDINRRFLEIDGRKVIPGSSLKGMLRSLVEIMSFSGLAPLNENPLVFRNFNDSYYKEIHNHTVNGRDEGQQEAGWLTRDGASYIITPVKFTKSDTGSAACPHKVKTGPKVPPPKDGSFPYNTYYFGDIATGQKSISVPPKLIQLFREQLSKKQIEILEERIGSKDVSMVASKALPVFFVCDDNGDLMFFGLPRYFRLPYKYKPMDLIKPGQGKSDFAKTLFGTVDGEAHKGRVSVQHLRLNKAELLGDADGYLATLGQPQATCLSHYLVQNPGQVRLMKKNQSLFDPDTLDNFNKSDASLRGRKLYWHRQWQPENNPKGNDNTDCRLHPVAAGAEGRFSIQVDRLSLVELGAILEAIDLPQVAAHKLGLGKALGLGSVRLEIVPMDTHLSRERDRYASLSHRLSGETENFTDLAEAKTAFKSFVCQELKAENDYEKLPAIKCLRAMMDYKNKPGNKKTDYMQLSPPKEDKFALSYKTKALLKSPLEVIKG